MNRADTDAWKSQVLDQIFAAFAKSPLIDAALVFKGARVLNYRLGGGRQSLDIDSNLRSSFVERHPANDEQRQFLEEQFSLAVQRHFESQPIVRFKLAGIRVRLELHPMGWNSFSVRLNVQDLDRDSRGLPALEIDVAAPEELSDSSIAPLQLGEHALHGYTLQRIAGEKLRAFLSSLPAYRAKLKKPGDAVRAKDIYDIARINRVHAIHEREFWLLVGEEFGLACRSRYIDCAGLETFQEHWQVTKETYLAATTLTDISFEESEQRLVAVVHFLKLEGYLPFWHPLPNKPSTGRIG